MKTQRNRAAASIIVLLLLSSFPYFGVVQAGVSATTITVPDQYLTIQEAINSAAAGDTVFVGAGTYYEHIVVNRTVSLVGENRDTTIIDGNLTGIVVNITQNYVNISGFTIRNSGQDPCVSGPPYGGSGVFMLGVDRCNISGNKLVNDGVGVQIEYGADSNTITNNIVTGNNMGISVAMANLNNVSCNWVSNNSQFSVGLPWGAQNTVVSGNYILSAGVCAIYVDGSSNNRLFRNVVADSPAGIWIFRSGNNGIYHNAFVNNVDSANWTSPLNESSIFNYWDDGYSFGGNYWSDYNGTDANHDGRGDSPYVVNENNTDRYPLMQPFSGIVVPDQYASIQSAINHANDGDDIFVRTGTYSEHVVVNKTVALIGENRDTTSIDGGYTGVVVNVTRDGVNISDFTVRRSGTTWNIGGPPYGAGLYMTNVTNCTIFRNAFSQDAVGVQMEFGADGNVIANNTMSSVTLGLGTFDASWNSFTGNNVTSNGRGMGLNVNSDYNVISGNRVTAAEWVLALHACHCNNITENYIANGQIGVYLPDSSDNRVYHNQIFGNIRQASVEGFPSHVNYWDDGYPSGGNCWGGYAGVDVLSGPYQNETNSDGIGDTCRTIDENNTDRYPLMQPYAGPHDVGVTVTVSKNVVAHGYNITVTMNVKVSNNGIQDETFNFTVQMFGAPSSEPMTLAARTSTTLIFALNTTIMTMGNYSILVQAAPVPGETNTTDNTFTGCIFVGVPGDVDGNRIVNMLDLYKIALIFGAMRGNPSYVADYDIEDNGIINMLDLYIAALHFGQTET